MIFLFDLETMVKLLKLLRIVQKFQVHLQIISIIEGKKIVNEKLYLKKNFCL